MKTNTFPLPLDLDLVLAHIAPVHTFYILKQHISVSSLLSCYCFELIIVYHYLLYSAIALY